MRRILLFLLVAAPLLVCFQCGCDEPDTIVTLRLENATGEELYWSRSAQPWANAECWWTRLPCSFDSYNNGIESPGEMLRMHVGGEYMLIVDSAMHLRASWPTDSLPMADDTRWVSDTTLLGSINCNGIHPTEYIHTFTLQPEDLLQ